MTLNAELIALANRLDAALDGPDDDIDVVIEHISAMRSAANRYGRLRVSSVSVDDMVPKMQQATALGGVIVEVCSGPMTFVVEIARANAYELLKREPNLGEWL